MPNSNPTSAQATTKDQLHAFPLSDFYTHAGLTLPRIEVITADALPEPYKTLLVHAGNLAPTLEAFYKGKIHLEILKRDQRGSFYFRQTVLRLDHDEMPVAFVANKIYVGRFPEDAREFILAEQVPLGRILKDSGFPHRTEARAFLRIESDELINEAFELEVPTTLYGRKAIVSDLKGGPLSEIVEILPPVAAVAK